CTGSGCIAISLAVLGGYDCITAADRSLEALKVAKKNGSSLLEGRKQLVFIESDMFSNLDAAEKYDIIVSNPPYIPSSVIEELAPEVREHEPRMALDGAEDGLYFYRILSDKSRAYLNDGGSIYFEIGYDQAEAVTGLLLNDGYKEVKVIKDEPGLDRVVEAVWHCK
ncbi:MAG: HemK/PrmC family methyltransferase, partial [Clostridium sp.]